MKTTALAGDSTATVAPVITEASQPREPQAMMSLLVIDDDPGNLEVAVTALDRDGLEILQANDPQDGLEIFFQKRPQVVLLDLMMPKMNGMQVLDKIVAADPAADVILMTAHYSTDSAVEAIQKGACDYLTKPLDLQKLQSRVASLMAEAKQRRRAAQLDQELLDTYKFENIIGRSPLMLELFAKIRRVAPHFRTALITGATGTGKELVAKALHRLSPVSAKTLAVCNCSAVVETLVESELFGYVKGAFTGAVQDKVGLFEYANGGTVFLDEVGEMPLAAQAKLLRVLQNHEIHRVGSPVTRRVDVRVIAATNRNLRQLVAENKFREDLYYRLSTVEITIPRLAERKEDLPLLQRHFLEMLAAEYNKRMLGFTRRAQALMAQYSWPGNVRELENVVANACMMVEGTLIDARDLPERLRSYAMEDTKQDSDLVSLDEMQRRHLLRVVRHCQGDKRRASEILGISRSSLYRLLADADSAHKGNGASD